MIVINYLDELMDNILDELHGSSSGNNKVVPKTNKDMEAIFHQAILSANIRKNIGKTVKKNKEKVVADNVMKVEHIFNRYVGIYVLLKEGVKLEDSLFINFLVFAYNNYMADILDANTNSIIIQMKRICTTMNSLFTSASSKKRVGEIAQAFPDVYEFYMGIGDDLLETIKRSSKQNRIHLLVKIVLYKILYSDRGKWEVQALFESAVVRGEYRYIDVLYGEDLSLSTDVIMSMFPTITDNDEVEDFMEFFSLNEAPLPPLTVVEKIQWLFDNRMLFPITQEFSRWHVGKSKNTTDIKKSNIVKAILSKIASARNPELAEKNQLWYTPKLPEPTLTFNALEEVAMLDRGGLTDKRDSNLYEDIRRVNNRHYFEFSLPAFSFSSPRSLQAVRLIHIQNPSLPLDLRTIRVSETFRIYGLVLASRSTRFSFSSFEKTDSLSIEQNPGSYVIFNDPGEVEPVVDRIYAQSQAAMVRDGNEGMLDMEHRVFFNQKRIQGLREKKEKNITTPCLSDAKDFFALQKIEVIEREVARIGEVMIRRKKTKGVTETKGLSLNAVCCHYAEIQRIRMMRNRRDFDGVQELSEFSSRYIALDGDHLVCKSCGVLMDIIKTMTSGISDTFTGEYIVSNVDTVLSIFQMNEYTPLLATLRQMDRLFDYKIGKIIGLPYLSGNEAINRRYRESLLRDAMDLIRVHNASLNLHVVKKDSDYRRADYGLDEGFTFLFAFKIDNQIMMMSSLDTDKFKRIKYNNILVYMVLLIIIDLSEQNIMSMDFKKKTCARLVQNNMGFFEKIKVISGVDGGVRSIDEFPVLAFVISFFACMLVEYRVYQFEKEEASAVAMKKMIVTMVDMLNTILFIATRKLDARSNLYRIFMSRFFKKQATVFIKQSIFDELMGRVTARADDRAKVKEAPLLPFPIKAKKEYTFIKGTVTRYQDPTLGRQPSPAISEHWWKQGRSVENLTEKIFQNTTTIKKRDSYRPELLPMTMGTVEISKPASSPGRGGKRLDDLFKEMDRFTQQKAHREDSLIVDHDFIGLPLHNPLVVKWSEVRTINKEPFFRRDVVYYTDANQTRVYYDKKHMNLLGYRSPHQKMTSYEGTPIYTHRKRPFDQTLETLGQVASSSSGEDQRRLNLLSFLGIVRSHAKRFGRNRGLPVGVGVGVSGSGAGAGAGALPFHRIFETYADRLVGKIEVGDAFNGVSFRGNSESIITYFAGEVVKILERNRDKKDDVRYPLISYLLDITAAADDWFRVRSSPTNKIFELQLSGRAYSVKGFSQYPQEEEPTEVIIDDEENKREDPEGNLGDMLNDIDVEEGNFDLDDD